MDGCWETVCNNSQEGIAGALCLHMELPSDGMYSSTQLTAIAVAQNQQVPQWVLDHNTTATPTLPV